MDDGDMSREASKKSTKWLSDAKPVLIESDKVRRKPTGYTVH